MDTEEKWENILKEAVAVCVKNSHAATGAKLREVLSQIAQKHGETYPPEGVTRFREFLAKFPTIVVVRKRPGQDILVAPTDQPNLLVVSGNVTDKVQSGIRRDLFEAFSFVKSATSPWYNVVSDTVEWLPSNDVPSPAESYKKIPAVTLNSAIDDRRKFIELVIDAERKEALTSTLTDVNSLSSFSKCIINFGLQPDWGKYRLTILTQRISDWAKDVGIAWKDSWLTESQRGEEISTVNKESAIEPSRQWRQAMLTLIQSLDQEDLSKISIPLDIALKALIQRR